VVLLASSAPGLRLLGEKIRIAVEALDVPHTGSSSGRVTISVGGATQMATYDDASKQLVEAADLALYRAKRDGKNRVIIT
jgi:two-component system chemotaxis family response regulator WspR